MNPLKSWIKTSREMAMHSPELYLAHYVNEVYCDDEHVWMTHETLDRIKRHCGEYDGTLPTGQYCGKMFIRHGELWWIGISKKNPMTNLAWKSRKIIVCDRIDLIDGGAIVFPDERLDGRYV